MSLATYPNSNKPKAPGRACQMDRVQAGAGTPTIASRLRKAFAAGARLFMHAVEAFAEARVQKAMIEAELYLNRYKHSSKNDDDLPVVR